MDWMNLVQNRDQWALVNTVKNLRVPKNAGRFLHNCQPLKKCSAPLSLFRYAQIGTTTTTASLTVSILLTIHRQ
jgi:hypothetical protein